MKIIVVILLFFGSCQGKSFRLEKNPERDFVNSMTLGEKMKVTWEVYNGNSTIIFEVTAAATGWVGLGFSDQANMFQSDMIMGGVTDNGTIYFSDRHADGPGRPREDTVQDYFLISANEENGTTRLRFYRKFDTGDAQDFQLEARNTWFLWAMGPNDDITQYHVADRGNAAVNVLEDPNSK